MVNRNQQLHAFTVRPLTTEYCVGNLLDVDAEMVGKLNTKTTSFESMKVTLYFYTDFTAYS